MIIRRLESSLQLITQPDHAALAARIIRLWLPERFPESSRKAAILHAAAEHDNGWAEIDETLVIDATTGQLLDFMEISDDLKRETSLRGLERLASDPYAAALVAQHRLHVYRRYAKHLEWSTFFAEVTTARDAYLRATGSVALDELLRDYSFVRAGDLAARVPEGKKDDELVSLSRAFNRMTNQIQSQQRELIDANRQLDRNPQRNNNGKRSGNGERRREQR